MMSAFASNRSTDVKKDTLRDITYSTETIRPKWANGSEAREHWESETKEMLTIVIIIIITIRIFLISAEFLTGRLEFLFPLLYSEFVPFVVALLRYCGLRSILCIYIRQCEVCTVNFNCCSSPWLHFVHFNIVRSLAFVAKMLRCIRNRLLPL